MCEVVQGFIDKGREEGRISTIRELVEGGLPLEKIFELLKIPESDRAALRERLA